MFQGIIVDFEVGEGLIRFKVFYQKTKSYTKLHIDFILQHCSSLEHLALAIYLDIWWTFNTMKSSNVEPQKHKQRQFNKSRE